MSKAFKETQKLAKLRRKRRIACQPISVARSRGLPGGDFIYSQSSRVAESSAVETSLNPEACVNGNVSDFRV